MRPATRARSLLAALTAVVAVACGPDRPARREALRPRGRVVARVDGEVVTDLEVAHLARALGLTPRAALDRAIRDHLLAREAARRGLVRPGDADAVAWQAAVQLVLAREVEEPHRPEALSERDVQQVLDLRRAELMHPGLATATHFVALVPPGAPPAADEAARALAARARAAVVAAGGEHPTPAQFQAATTPLVTDATRSEALPPFASSGVAAGGARFDARFTACAWALTPAAPLSAPCRSDFGYHVILRTGEVPPTTTTRAEAEATVRRDLALARRRRALRDLVARLGSRHEVLDCRRDGRCEVRVSPVVLRALDAVGRGGAGAP